SAWVLVGGTALAAHLNVHRSLADIDINYLDGNLDAAVEDLNERLRVPNRDGLIYVLNEDVNTELLVGGSFSMQVKKGETPLTDIQLDIGVNRALIQPPVSLAEPFIPEANLPYQGVVVAHQAEILTDKLLAMFKPETFPDGRSRIVDRFKDMLDAVAIEQQLKIDAEILAALLNAKADQDGVDLNNLKLASERRWRLAYGREMVKSPSLAVTLPPFDEAYGSLRLMCNSALSGAKGIWNSEEQVFRPDPVSAAQDSAPRGSSNVRLSDVNPEIARMAKKLPHAIGGSYDPYGPAMSGKTGGRRGR
ncbi:MAG: nucleotidyl transferase AbiEii/AbiGii toxin family protein, partial [Mycobacteriales bacterium]